MNKILKILRQDSSFFYIIFIYGVCISLLTLAIPISTQALVNIVNFGMAYQPLIVIVSLLVLFLSFSSILSLLQFFVLEKFQRVFYARITSQMVHANLFLKRSEFLNESLVDKRSYYFETINVQKSVSKVIVEGISIIIQIFLGMILLGLYHYYFIVFNVLLLLAIYLIWKLAYERALKYSIKESKAKHNLFNWISNLSLNNNLFRRLKPSNFALTKADSLVEDYINTRSIHFKELMFQSGLFFFLYVAMSALVLGLSGYLVMIGKLTIGQLVASEIVIMMILVNISKAGKYLESFYDLYASIDKIEQVVGLKEFEDLALIKIYDDNEKPLLSLDKVTQELRGKELLWDFSFEKGKVYSVHERKYSHQSLLIDLIQGHTQPLSGQLLCSGMSYDQLNIRSLSQCILFVGELDFFSGTIYENLVMGNTQVTRHEVQSVLDLLDLLYLTEEDPNLETKISINGYPLRKSQLVRLEIARTMLQKPKIVLFDDTYLLVDPAIMNNVFSYFKENQSVVICFSGAREGEREIKELGVL